MDDDDELMFWRTIKLTKGQRVMVDVDDFEEVSKHKWFAFRRTYKPTGTTYFYACRRVRGADGIQRGLLMHRHLMNAGKGQEVDHVNGITTDCRRANLRLVDRRANQNNRRDHSEWGQGIDQQTPRKGRPFRARVFIGGRSHYVGHFATAAEARAARAAFLEQHK